MKQGSTFVLIVNLNVDLSRINSVIFTLKNKDVTLTKENWTYNNGKFELPFTQEETVQLQGRTRIEAQINFADGNVAKTQIKDIYIKETLATRIIDDNIATQEGEEVELDVDENVIYVGGGVGTNDYNNLENKPKINGVVILGDVSLDDLNIASKEYVEEEIAKFDFVKIVPELPEVGLPNRTYLVPKAYADSNDLYDEYIWTGDGWEFIGTKTIEIDLSEYVKKTDDDFIRKVTNTSTMNRVYGIGHSGTDTTIFTLGSGVLGVNTIPMRNANGTFSVGTPIEDLNPTNKKYVDDKTSYKTLVDVTLDDSNSGSNSVMVELPLDDFLSCNEFITYVEFPITESVSNATISGYITNITQGAYSQCFLYTNGSISANASGKHRAFSQTNKIKNGMLLTLCGNPTSYTGANSSNTNVRSVMEQQIKASYREYPPYLKISIDNYTFPSGTRIIMEGR